MERGFALMRFVGKVLLIVAALLVATELFFAFRPEPTILTAGVPLGDGPVSDLLRKRFPIGSPASDLEEELKHEGYWGSIRIARIGRLERFLHYVRYERRVGLFTPEVTTIVWEVGDGGRLTDVKGSKYLDLPVP